MATNPLVLVPGDIYSVMHSTKLVKPMLALGAVACVCSTKPSWSTPQPARAWPRGYPIINLGMPKCGSTSLHSFMDCNAVTDIHYAFGSKGYVASGFRRCNALGVSKVLDCVVEDMGSFESLSQIDGPRWKEGAPGWVFPQITDLANLLTEYPGATFVLMVRDPVHWATSVEKWWPNRKLANIIADFSTQDRSSPYYMTNSNTSELSIFYQRHTDRVKRLCHNKKIKVHTIDLGENSGIQLAHVLRSIGKNTSTTCWKHANKS